jgi:hypothetical protein
MCTFNFSLKTMSKETYFSNSSRIADTRLKVYPSRSLRPKVFSLEAYRLLEGLPSGTAPMKLLSELNQCNLARIRFNRLTALVIVLYSAFTPMAIWAQSVSGYEHNALAGATVALSALSYSLSMNPAAVEGGSVAWYGTRHFGISDLDETGVYLAIPMNYRMKLSGQLTALAFEFHHFGFDLYREVRGIAGVGLKAGNLNIGVAPGFRHTTIPNYGSTTEFFFNAGFIYSLSNDWQIGGFVNQIGLHYWGNIKPDERSTVGTGLVYNATERLQWLFGGQHETGFTPSASSALRLWLLNEPSLGSLWISVGYTTMNDSWSGGFKYRYRNLAAGFALMQHPFLGRSHGLGFDTFWNKGSNL